MDHLFLLNRLERSESDYFARLRLEFDSRRLGYGFDGNKSYILLSHLIILSLLSQNGILSTELSSMSV